MAKVLSEKKKKQRSRLAFVCFLLVWSLVLMGAASYGLNILWDFLDAYEQSRPYHAIDAYMQKLTADYVCGKSGDLLTRVDSSIQSEEESLAVIRGALSEGFSYAKKTSECTDTKLVYVLRSGSRVIGQMVMEPQGEAVYGFTPWAVTGDSFDMSFLLTGTVSTIAPHDYPVYVNGYPLDSSHLTGEPLHYAPVEEYYEDYTPPYMVTYTAGPCLGEISAQVTDLNGDPLTIDESTDTNAFVNNCSAELSEELEVFLGEFITRYVAYSSSTSENMYSNFRKLDQYLMPDGELSDRLYSALNGLKWGRDERASVKDVFSNYLVEMGEGCYMCDFTYTVDTKGTKGTVSVTTNMKLVVLRTEDGLKVESLSNY